MDHELERFQADVERIGNTLAEVMNAWEQEADDITTGTFSHVPAMDWFVRTIADQTGQHVYELGARAVAGEVPLLEAANDQRMALMQVIELALRVGFSLGEAKYVFATCQHVEDLGHVEMSDDEITGAVEELLHRLRLN